jgi:hypothetical protein
MRKSCGTCCVLGLVALLMLSTAFVLAACGNSGGSSPTPSVTHSLSVSDVETMLHDRLAAMKAADVGALGAFYATDAVLEDLNGGNVREGTAMISAYIAQVREAGYLMRLNGEPIVLGDRYVVQPVTLYAEGQPARTGATGANVLELDANGRIVHEWMTSMK